MSAIKKIMATMYIENEKVFKINAQNIIKKFYSIPIDENDLISECLQQLMKKAIFFVPTIEQTLENYLLSNIKFVMYSYCRSFTRKNYAILNNYVDFELIENFHSKTYNVQEVNLNVLSELQKEIIKYLYIDNLSIKEVATKKTTTSNIIKIEIKEIKSKIKMQMDNFIDL